MLQDCNIFKKTGYTCVQWSTSIIQPNLTCTIDDKSCFHWTRPVYNIAYGGKEIVLNAVWESNVYQVNLDNTGANLGGGTTVIYEKYDVGWFSNSNATSSMTQITIPTKRGYTFAGYYTAPNGTGTQIINASGKIVGNTNSFANNTTLYVKWTPNIYTLTLNRNGGSGGSAAIYEKYEHGWYSNSAGTSSITHITKPTRTNYTFGGYYLNAAGTGTQVIDKNGKILVSNTTYLSNTTLYAKWWLTNINSNWTSPSTYTYQIPTTGTYRLTAYGAQGNGGGGGYGGGAVADVRLTVGTNLTIIVGGQNGYNGGGTGNYNGGGATHIKVGSSLYLAGAGGGGYPGYAGGAGGAGNGAGGASGGTGGGRSGTATGAGGSSGAWFSVCIAYNYYECNCQTCHNCWEEEKVCGGNIPCTGPDCGEPGYGNHVCPDGSCEHTYHDCHGGGRVCEDYKCNCQTCQGSCKTTQNRLYGGNGGSNYFSSAVRRISSTNGAKSGNGSFNLQLTSAEIP